MQRCALSGAVFAVAFAAFHHYTHVLNPITRHLPAPSVNWDRTVSLASSSHTVIRPKFLYEVQKLVRDAAASGQKVKVVGAGHSWSTIAAPGSPDSTTVVSLDNMNRILNVNKDLMVVSTQGGVRLVDLYARLAAAGLGIANAPSVNEQSIAGALSTGTHGSGGTHPGMAASVVEMTFVNGLGEVQTFGPEQSPDKLPAVRVGLGALGIITEVTLRVVPLHRTFVHEFLVQDAVFLSKLPEYLLFSGHSSKAWRIPHTNHTLIMSHVDVGADGRSLKQVPLGEALPQLKLAAAGANFTHDYRTVPEAVTEFFAYVSEAVAFVTALFPPIRVFTSPIISQVMFTLPKTRIARSDQAQIVPFRVPRHTEMEYAVPGVECADTLAELTAWMEKQGVFSDFVHEVRMSRRDGDWLSMGYHPEHDPALLAAVGGADIHHKVDPFSLYSSFLSPKERKLCSPAAMQKAGAEGGDSLKRRDLLCNTVCHTTIGLGFGRADHLQKYFAGFEAIALRHGGRPHWAKRFYADAKALSKAYPRMAAWREIRQQMDPHNVFVNEYVARVVGL